jgi:hypothetical protein
MQILLGVSHVSKELNQMHEAHQCNEERRNKINPKKINKSHLSIANNEGFT